MRGAVGAVAGEAEPDQLVGGRYRLVSRLGAGGFGQVWQAHDEALRVDVAIKEVWLPGTVNDAERAQRVVRAERESRNAARLRSHPNIVTVHDVVVENGLPWTVMQLVTGTSLADHITSHGPLPVGHAVKVAAALLSALGAAHDAGIVHRDVKPGNVMLADDGQVLLTDFGIAVHQADTALTAGDGVIGSIEYIAPERARGADAQAASDLFSLGATLYQALEGVSPFRRDTPTATLAAILLDEPPAPRRSGELAQLITRLLAKDPLQRPTVPAAEAMVDGMSHGMGPTAVVTVADLAVAAPRLGAATVLDPDVTEDSEAAAPASAKAARAQTPRLPADRAALREEAPAPETAAAPDRRTGRPKRVRIAAVSGAVIVVIVAIAVSLALWGPGRHAPDPLDSLRDPCKAVPQSELSTLGLESVNPTHHTENVDSRDRWCEWGMQADTLLTVGYGTESAQHLLAGYPEAVPYRGIKGAYEYLKVDVDGSCVVWWPTSFGEADVSYAPQPESHDCSTAEQLARAVYPNLSR